MRDIAAPDSAGMVRNGYAIELLTAIDRATAESVAQRARTVIAMKLRQAGVTVRHTRPVAAARRAVARRTRPATRRRSRVEQDDGAGDPEPPPPPPGRRPDDTLPRRVPRLVHPASVTGRATAYGIDTVRFAFRDSRIVDALSPLPSHHPITGERLRWSPQDRGARVRLVNGASAVLYHDHVTLEWRLAALLADDARVHRLAVPRELREGLERAADLLGDLAGGVRPHGPAGLARCDLAAELCFDEPPHGRLWLASLAQLNLSRLQRIEWTSGRGYLESVDWRRPSTRQKAIGAYDAGIAHRSDPAGARIRVERELRATRAQQRTPEQLLAGDLGAMFMGAEIAHMIDAPGRIVLVAAPSRIGAVIDQLDATELVRRRLRGAAHAFEHGEHDENAVAYLRRHGIVLSRKASENEVVDVAPGLRALGAVWRCETHERAA
jgi:hypothetical protein